MRPPCTLYVDSPSPLPNAFSNGRRYCPLLLAGISKDPEDPEPAHHLRALHPPPTTVELPVAPTLSVPTGHGIGRVVRHCTVAPPCVYTAQQAEEVFGARDRQENGASAGRLHLADCLVHCGERATVCSGAPFAPAASGGGDDRRFRHTGNCAGNEGRTELT